MKRKVCLLGAFAAGKTSLVRRKLHGTFSETYLTTIGVRIDKLDLRIESDLVELVVWDLHGQDRFQSVQSSYLQGAAGFMVVVDLSRPETFAVGQELERKALAAVGSVPVQWVFNKRDLGPSELRDEERETAGVRASALTGEGVDEAFFCLGAALVRSGGRRAR